MVVGTKQVVGNFLKLTIMYRSPLGSDIQVLYQLCHCYVDQQAFIDASSFAALADDKQKLVDCISGGSGKEASVTFWKATE